MDEVDIKILKTTQEGRKYIEYHEKFNNIPFAYGVGMPNIDEMYCGVIGLYDECIKQNTTWQELVGSGWDEKPS
ncbi:hypothetical protein [Siminovitchia acidinfaciens]|uniref:hypothetical protein n=1 Tax=Siminovitchia acidinfaciens TaxID=2321395 RepID=UPI000EDC76EC|nr:hypothetical protein [Siminovitchia acidinfaciens]